jgi:hypothetical protein
VEIRKTVGHRREVMHRNVPYNCRVWAVNRGVVFRKHAEQGSQGNGKNDVYVLNTLYFMFCLKSDLTMVYKLYKAFTWLVG